MTIGQSFIQFLEENNVATFGQDLFLRRAPDSKNTPSSIYWVIPSGGTTLSTNHTGEKLKQYTFTINYRSTKAIDVEEKLFDLEELLNCKTCVELEGFDVISVRVDSFYDDGDYDEEDRETGLIQATVEVYKTC